MLIGVTGFKLARLVLNLWVEGTQACAYSQFVSRRHRALKKKNCSSNWRTKFIVLFLLTPKIIIALLALVPSLYP